ncbi:MAG TPA: hypothetical protein VM553_19370, partial [Dongiaceae bacterium]|nr:hypothetical protein [Dongiaceae bacterium]
VLDLATLQTRSIAPPDTNDDPGLGVSRTGVIADVNSDFGDGAWKIDLRSLDLGILNTYSAGSVDLLSFATSAAALNADATLIAFSVNEMTSTTDDTRIDRIYIANLVTHNYVKTIVGFEEPVFIGTGELLARDDNDRLFVFDANFANPQDLQLEVSPKHGSYSASPDGRYIAYDSSSALHSQITVYDRNTGNSWLATDTAVLGCWAPVFSPDGKWLAFLMSGSSAGTWLHIIPFEPGTTRTITDGDATEVKTATGDAIWVNASYGWAN